MAAKNLKKRIKKKKKKKQIKEVSVAKVLAMGLKKKKQDNWGRRKISWIGYLCGQGGRGSVLFLT